MISPVLEISAFQPDTPAPAWEKENEVDDNDKLGYYDDGVKRTLADEQIAIFRHSEVQRLLQHRRLNADLAGSQAEIEAHKEPGKSKQSERTKRNKHFTARASARSEAIKLGYGQDGEEPVSSAGQVENQSHHRRIVRYDDGLDELDQPKSYKDVDPSKRVSNSKSYNWPQLGP